MSDLEAFRAEARAWLDENAPDGVRGMKADELNGVWGGKRFEFEHPDQKIWLDRMGAKGWTCLLYTSPSPRDKRQSRMPSSA